MRTIQDPSFRTWEAFATTGPYGASNPSRIVFRCLSDQGERARAVRVEGDKAAAEARVRTLGDQELKELLGQASVID